MAPKWPPLLLLLALGMWAVPNHGETTQDPTEPVTTPPETPSLPPTTPPEPPGPPRLRLVDGESGCSGSLELYREGVWGAVASGVPPELATRLCQALGCGSAIRDHWKPGPGSHLPVRWEAVEPCGSRPLLTCFNRTGTRTGRAPAAISCSGSSPRALRRLWGGPTPCEGDLEVFAGGRWQVLCDTGTRRAAWGQELCQELRCGNLSSSTEIRDPPATGVTCGVPTLRLCPHHLGDTRSCSRTRVVCQASKPQPPGTGAGTILSICLGLLLAALLLLTAPPACRSLLRRVSQKKQQRQWIGPTGLNQTVSFHRPSTATSRPRVPGGDNDYSQAPQKTSPPSSASPGTTGAPNPPDNSSDSDYDLSSAHRL